MILESIAHLILQLIAHWDQPNHANQFATILLVNEGLRVFNVEVINCTMVKHIVDVIIHPMRAN